MIFLVRTLPYVLGSSGLEPPTSRLSGARSNQLSYEPASLCGSTRLSSFELQHFLLSGFSLVSFKQSTGLFEFPSGTVPFRIPSFFPKDPIGPSSTRTSRPFWWRWWDSNPWPPACRAGALPTELHPHLVLWLYVFSQWTLSLTENWTTTSVRFRETVDSCFAMSASLRLYLIHSYQVTFVSVTCSSP